MEEKEDLYINLLGNLFPDKKRKPGLVKHIQNKSITSKVRRSATHLLQSGTNLHMIQVLLGHNQSSTMELFPHILRVINKNQPSPLVSLSEILNLIKQTKVGKKIHSPNTRNSIF